MPIRSIPGAPALSAFRLDALNRRLDAPLPPAVQGALLERIGKEQECAAPNPETLAYLCRAMAPCPGSTLRTNKLLTLLQTQPSPALLLAIAGRLWPDLKDANLLSHYLEQLALQPTQFFNQVFAELVTLPALRNDMLARLRDPDRSDALGKAIGRLFASACSLASPSRHEATRREIEKEIGSAEQDSRLSTSR